MAGTRLTIKQQKFIEEYTIDFNARQAAIRAGYSEKTANVIGPENLAKPLVAASLAELLLKRRKEINIEAKRVILELCCLSFYDVADMMDENSNLLPVHEIPEQTRRAIVGVKQTRRVIAGSDDSDDQVIEITTDYKLANKDSSLDKLSRHLGIYLEDNKQQGGNVKMTFNLGGAK